MFETAPIELITAIHGVSKELRELQSEIISQNIILVDAFNKKESSTDEPSFMKAQAQVDRIEQLILAYHGNKYKDTAVLLEEIEKVLFKE